ncbi:MAG: PfkB family carbohydrate kinase [Terriglobia bacterium]
MTPAELLSAFPKLNALVVGDICLDRWCTYDPALSEPSQETGMPRIGVIATEATAGGGGTVANNLAALGAGKVAVLGVRGDDGSGFELLRALDQRGISTELMVEIPAWHTFTYTKLLNRVGGLEDQPRVDFIALKPLPTQVEQRIVSSLASATEGFDVIYIADQAETDTGGVVTKTLRNTIAELADRYPRKVFLADSRKRVHLLRKVMIKPNRAEAETACQQLFGTVDFPRLRQSLEARALMITHGPKGVLVVEENNETWAKACPIENPVDTCGAGDSFAAGAALAMAVAGDPIVGARFGNLVASVTVMKKGTGTASPAEVMAAADRQNPAYWL